MQKKIMAVAVAGALALPVTVLAQTSTVNIYGNMTAEYGMADGGRGKPNADYSDVPGGSAIGFRGEEKLGGGLSAWFQCESSADLRGFDQVGWCSRNSAVGFKGSFGNVFFGRWDTPFKRALGVGTVGAEETGLLGMSFLPFGGSGGASAQSGTGVNGLQNASSESNQRQRWKRRETGVIYYETPRWGGFQGMAAFTSGTGVADYGFVDGTTNDKSRVSSLAVTYSAGPLGIGAGYEKHAEFGTPCAGGVNVFSTMAPGAPFAATAPAACPASGLADFDDSAWGGSIAYTFGGKIKVGATFIDKKWETAIGRELKSRAWTVGVDWAIVGPHSVQAQYARVLDSKGNSTARIGGNAGAEAPLTAAGAAVSDTGANAISIAYSYAFSKRTRVKLGYVRVDNDTNANIARIGNTSGLIAGGAPTANGQTVDGWAFHVRHRF